MPRLLLTLCLLTGSLSASLLSADTKSRYVAYFRDGTSVSSNAPPTWHTATSGARFADQLLFAPEREVQFLRDRSARIKRKPPYVVLANGDILPAIVASFESSSAKFGHRPTMLAVLEEPLNPVQGNQLPIRADRVERIVTTAHPLAAPQVNEVLLTDGRRFVARSIRFSNYGLTLLTDQGLVNANFAEIADATFAVDRQQAVLEDSIAAGELLHARIARLGTFEGAVLTGAHFNSRVEYERDRRRRTSNRQRVLLAQPAWALEELTLLEASVCQSSFRHVNELPLSLLASETIDDRGLLGTAFPWQRNATVRGEVLASSDREADWGLGTHAPCAVAYDLPDYAEQLSLTVGLDRSVGGGGCVVCQIRKDNQQGEVLWSSGMLRGEDGPQKVGPLKVAGVKRIVLVTDIGHEGRPVGADPLDIRDDVVWLAPQVTIDRDAILTPQSAAGFLGNLAEWEIDALQLVETELTNVWNNVANRWDTVVRVKPKHELTFKRKLLVSVTNDILELATAIPTELAHHHLELRVDGDIVEWSTDTNRERESREALRLSFFAPRPTIPSRRETVRDDTLRYWWNLKPHRGREVTLSLKLVGDERGADITWRSLVSRSAVNNLPPSGKLPTPDVSLTAITPTDITSRNNRESPTIDQLPLGRDKPLTFLGQPFTGGYCLARSSSISFPLQADYRRFIALVGTCTEQSGPLRVLIDGRVVWECPTKAAAEGADCIELLIPAGSAKLTLEIGPDGGYHGFSAFANAGFMLK